MDFSFLLSNSLINMGVISWIVAQLIKTGLDAVKHRAFNRQRLSGAGGMPSSHSAVCCSVVLTSYFLYGFQSPVFALAVIMALIVMYDATGVRWAAGLHAKAINQIVEYLESEDPNNKKESLNDMIPRLNESLGHRVIEVICGALLGIVIAIIGQLAVKEGFSFPDATLCAKVGYRLPLCQQSISAFKKHLQKNAPGPKAVPPPYAGGTGLHPMAAPASAWTVVHCPGCFLLFSPAVENHDQPRCRHRCYNVNSNPNQIHAPSPFPSRNMQGQAFLMPSSACVSAVVMV